MSIFIIKFKRARSVRLNAEMFSRADTGTGKHLRINDGLPIFYLFSSRVYNFSTVMLHSQLFVYNNRKKENRKKTKKHFEYLLK